MYVGPKSLHSFGVRFHPDRSGHTDLRDLVNFGFFGLIARALFIWLRWTYTRGSQLGLGDRRPDPHHYCRSCRCASPA